MAEPSVIFEPVGVVFENGAALSNSFDMRTFSLTGLLLADGWTTASIGFYGSVDNQNFYPIQDKNGDRLELLSPGNEKYITTDAILAEVPYVKLWSRTGGTDVAQTPGSGQQRTLTVVRKTG